MTITKVISGIDIMIANKQRLREEFLNLQKSWRDTDTLPMSFVKSMTNLLDLDINILTQFKEHLQKEVNLLKQKSPRSKGYKI